MLQTSPAVLALLVSLTLFAASFTQGLSGFGLALVSMPFLIPLVGVRTAAPLVAVLSGAIQVPVLLRYHADVDRPAVLRLVIPYALGIPLGVLALGWANPALVVPLLGVVIIAYAVYALAAPGLPLLRHPAWAYPFGLAGGLLSGAYSTGGPPLIIFGDFRRWEPGAFKGSLQVIFMIGTVVQLVSHGLAGNLTGAVWQNTLFAAPGVVLGVLAGLYMDRFINPAAFRKIVLVLLIALGAGLII
jgi:hypothetical protein